MRRILELLMFIVLLAGCAVKEPMPVTPPADRKDAPVVRRPLEAPAAQVPQLSGPSVSAPAAPLHVPINALYVCVSESQGQRHQTAIEFSAKVAALCKRHPEMGPCQYERDVCRRSGGRVYAANGQEITQRIEDEYDRKVLRVRFRAN